MYYFSEPTNDIFFTCKMEYCEHMWWDYILDIFVCMSVTLSYYAKKKKIFEMMKKNIVDIYVFSCIISLALFLTL